jgi:hypothetical protein
VFVAHSGAGDVSRNYQKRVTINKDIGMDLLHGMCVGTPEIRPGSEL